MKTCTVIGCHEPRYQTATNLYPRCANHMKQYWSKYQYNGAVDFTPIARAPYHYKDASLCVVEGCNEPRRVIESGHCKRCEAHQKQYRRAHYESWRNSTHARSKPCAVKGCTEPRHTSKSGNLVYLRCKQHQREYKRAQLIRRSYSQYLGGG